MATRSDGNLEISFAPLTPGFVVAKPIQWGSYDEAKIYELERRGRLIITRKRDGFKLYAVKNNGCITIYTSGVNVVDERVDHIRKELESLHLPDRTMVIGEAIVDVNGSDEFTLVESLFKCRTKMSLEKQIRTAPLRYMVFNVAFWDGDDLLSDSNEDRLNRVAKIFGGNREYLLPLTVLNISYDEAKKLVEAEGWEGLVLYDADAGTSYRLDGKDPQRPDGCFKWKPLYEDDFMVREFIPSPTDPDRLKELVLLQIDPVTGREFYCGKLGTFSAKMRETLRRAQYPLVVQVEFEARYESGALRNARFMRLRSDKPATDCIASRSYPKAKNM